MNVIHAEIDTLTSPPNWASIAGDVYTWLGPAWQNTLSSTYTFDDITVTDENYQGSTFGQGVHPVGVAGARIPNNTNLDRAICMVASFKTALAKRYARGHFFFPPALDGTILTAGGIFNPSSAYKTACEAFMNGFVAGHAAGSTGYVAEIFSRTHTPKLQESPPLWGPPAAYPVIAGILRNSSHFLRSRQTVP